MGFSNLSKFPEMHTGFHILRCTKFDIPNSSGKYLKPRIHLSLEFAFYFGNSCDEDKSTLYVPGSPYLVHSCASDVIWWMAKHCCQVRAGLGPRLQRHKCQVRAGLGLRLLWVNGILWIFPGYSLEYTLGIVAGPDGSFVSTGACNLEVHTRFESQSGRIFVIVVVYIQCPKLFKGLECKVLPMVLCTMKNPWSLSK